MTGEHVMHSSILHHLHLKLQEPSQTTARSEV